MCSITKPEMSENAIESGCMYPVERMLRFRECVELSSDKTLGESFSVLISVGEGDDKWSRLPDKVRENVYRGVPEEKIADDDTKKKKPKAKAKSKSTSGKANGKGYNAKGYHPQWEAMQQMQAQWEEMQMAMYTQWSASIRQQVEFYFSEANLATDAYLKQQMNEEGWVPAVIIGSFKKIRQLGVVADDLCNHLQDSKEVEVDEEKRRIRRRG